MSVTLTVNTKELSNHEKWYATKNGDFVFISNAQIQSGLYRVFRSTTPENEIMFMLCPMHDGPFQEGMFPYVLSFADETLPNIDKTVMSININVEVLP